MLFPNHLKYTKEHEWIHVEGKNATIGVTHFAIEQLGDVVYLDLPKEGSTFKTHDSFGTIESTKTVSDLYSPVDCKVTQINQAVVDSPESLAKDAYDQGWLVKVEVEGPLPSSLLNAQDYENYIKHISN